MHIGFLTIESPMSSTQGGGIAAYLRAIIPALIQAGHRVTVIANDHNVGIHYRNNDALRLVHIRLPSLHWYLSKFPIVSKSVVLPLRQVEWSFKFYNVARKIFKKDPVDVLECSESGALLLARRPIARLVIRLHGSDYIFRKHTGEALPLGSRYNRRLELAALRRAQAVTSPSQYQAEEVAQEMGWEKERISVIPNPISPYILGEALKQETRSNKPSSEIILYTGRLAPVKGILPLLDAAEDVRRAFPRAHFVLAGPWQMGKRPEQFGLKENGRDDSAGVKWLGHVPWNNLVEWYRAATIFIMPSYYETFGISCLEAMAFGLPVVATSAGGLPEIIEDGVNGVLVAPGDKEGLAEAIIGLLKDPELCFRMGQAGQERVLSKFSVEKVTPQLFQLYEKIQNRS